MAMALGILIKRITIQPTEESGLAGHVEFDHDAVAARFNLIQDKDQIGRFLMDMAMVGAAGEAVDLVINQLTPEIAAARSSRDFDSFRWFCNYWQIPVATQNEFISRAKNAAQDYFRGSEALANVNKLAERLMREETIKGTDLAHRVVQSPEHTE